MHGHVVWIIIRVGWTELECWYRVLHYFIQYLWLHWIIAWPGCLQQHTFKCRRTYHLSSTESLLGQNLTLLQARLCYTLQPLSEAHPLLLFLIVLAIIWNHLHLSTITLSTGTLPRFISILLILLLSTSLALRCLRGDVLAIDLTTSSLWWLASTSIVIYVLQLRNVYK